MTARLDSELQRILVAAQGNRTLAQRELVRRALGDDLLLRELVAPFLKSIAAQAVERALPKAAAPVPRGLSSLPLGGVGGGIAKAALDPQQAGYNPMRAAASLNDPTLSKRPDASQRHVSTLKLLAAAYAVKRGERV